MGQTGQKVVKLVRVVILSDVQYEWSNARLVKLDQSPNLTSLEFDQFGF
jgi:hypothetical protein